jgi:hypothetical protein
MATPGKDIAPFLQNNPAASGGAKAAGNPPFENRPQKDGATNQPDGDSKQRGPDRPQPMKSPAYSPESIPSGGTLPYKGPSVPTQTPFTKLK